MIKSFELTTHENKDIKNFSFLDLKDKVNGSEDLLILQYFLKKEGTYLHYLINKSANRRWRQKLSFKLDNMKIIKDFDTNEVKFFFEFY